MRIQSLDSIQYKVSVYFWSSEIYIKRSISFRCLFGLVFDSHFRINCIPQRLLVRLIFVLTRQHRGVKVCQFPYQNWTSNNTWKYDTFQRMACFFPSARFQSQHSARVQHLEKVEHIPQYTFRLLKQQPRFIPWKIPSGTLLQLLFRGRDLFFSEGP